MIVERVWPRFSHHRGFITRTTTVASLSAARLSYPGGAPTQPLCLDIQRPASGGHALLGSNGHGKTLLAQALLDDSLLLSGELKRPGRGARVSFESHQELLAKGGTVYKALGYDGTLSAAVKTSPCASGFTRCSTGRCARSQPARSARSCWPAPSHRARREKPTLRTWPSCGELAAHEVHLCAQ